MMSTDARHLSQLLIEAAARRPCAPAVEDEQGRTLTYEQLEHEAERLGARLARWGVGRGDRVGLFLPKGLEAVSAIHGVLRTGAAYVPVDPTAPAIRGAGILAECGVRAVVVAAALAPALRECWPGPGPLPRLVIVGGNEVDPNDASWEAILADDAPTPRWPVRRADDLAYILWTSGSTGRPKGVMLSHANAFCFLDWCEDALDLRDGERFGSHAPFHFDLSVFDLFASCRRAGTLVIAGEATGRDPARLGPFLDAKAIDVWYSAPSILALMADHGGLARHGFRAPRLVLFAGEVFPIAALKRLRALWPSAAMWNLYGPTETNVCTAEPIPRTIPAERAEPFPIGRVCPPLKARVIDADGRDVPPGTIGELLISGPGVTRGYFARPDLTAEAFLKDGTGTSWYRTGDLVELGDEGRYRFRGRRDRMVKKRGYRIELGEIETAIHRHEDVETAAVVAKTDDDGTAISAFVAMKPGRKPSIIAMKRHCSLYLPHYMIPDRVAFVAEMPRTSTDKVDYRKLVDPLRSPRPPGGEG